MRIVFKKIKFFTLFFLLIGVGQAYAQCALTPVSNLVANGDFSSGNVGFTSGYTYCNTMNCLYPEGYYGIGTDANYFHNAFTGNDHTSGTGNFLVVNGAGAINTIIWNQNIVVKPNVNYNFSIWVASMDVSSPAALQFEINGVALGSIFNAPTTLNNWQNFFITWNSGPSNSATITILNQNTTLGGNDFGIDDISFQEVCPTQQPNLGNDQTLCGANGIVLNTNITPTSTTIIQWNDGSSGTGITAPYTKNISAPGKYWVCVQDGSCVKTDTINILANFSVNLGPDIILCAQTSVTLNAGYKNNYTSYQWFKNTVLISDSAGSTLFVTTPGTYSVSVTDASCMLTRTSQVHINATSAIPVNSQFCPPQQAIFSVTPNPAGGFLWYSSPNNGAVVGSGNSFSKTLTQTTTYYAQDTTSFYYNVGPNTQFPSGFPQSAAANEYIAFDALTAFTLRSVTVYANVYNINAVITVGITLRDNAGNLISSLTQSVTGPPIVPANNIWPFTIPVNFNILPGTGYRLSNEGTIGQLFFAQQGSNVVTWPYAVPNVISLTGMSSAYQWPGCNCYGFFYNWVIAQGNNCARVPVQAKLNCPLPLNWLSFEASKQNDKTVLLSWTTANEKEVVNFQIERSTDGVHFETIGSIHDTGNKEEASYTYTDHSIEAGTYYYRIKETDINGSHLYSSIRTVNIEAAFILYPNPTSDKVNILFKENPGAGLQVMLFNSLGQELIQTAVQADQIELDLSAYSSGVYTLKIISANGIFVDKVIRK